MAFPVDKKKADGWEIFDDSMHFVLLGGLLFGAYKVLSGRKANDSDSEGTPNTDVPNIPATAPYEDKVRALQTALKVGVDGKAGKETNGALEVLFTTPPTNINYDTALAQNYPSLRAKGKGKVSPDNVNFYINALKTQTFPLAIYNKSKSVSQDANSIKNAYAKGGLLKTKGIHTFRGVVKDNARNVWVTTGKNYSYKSGVTFISPEIASRSYVSILEITKSGNLIVRVVTLTSTYFLIVPPSSVIVS